MHELQHTELPKQPPEPARAPEPAPAAGGARTPQTRVIAVAFVAVVALPLLASLAALASGARGDERAEAYAPTPQLRPSLSSLKALPGSFTWYFEHRYGFKDEFAQLHARTVVSLFGVSPTTSVVLGDNGWLFLGAEHIQEQYRPGHLFSPVELAKFAGAFETRRRWLAERGIPYLVVLCPSAQTIYPEHLPPALRPRTSYTRTDQLIEQLQRSSVRVADLRPALRAVAGQVRLFHKTDTHWNAFGAYVGSIAVMQALKQHFFPQLALPVVDPRKHRTRSAAAGDLARMMALRNDYREELVEPVGVGGEVQLAQGGPYVVPDLDPAHPGGLHELRGTRPQLGRALIYRDSFGLATMPYLGAFFERAVFQHSYALDRAQVERERPDVVIQLLVERKLMTLQLDGFEE